MSEFELETNNGHSCMEYLNFFDVISEFFRSFFDVFFLMFCLSISCLFYIFAFLCFVVLCFVIDPFGSGLSEYLGYLWYTQIL